MAPTHSFLVWVFNVCIISSCAPEYSLTWIRKPSTDIYALALVFLELLIGSGCYAQTNIGNYEDTDIVLSFSLYC